MPFIYDIKVNGQPIEHIELGFTKVRDLEEALDNGKITILLGRNKPFPMYSLVEIKVIQLDDWDLENEIDSKSFDMIAISDKVETISKELEYYKHELTFIEYTAKFDTYLMNNLSFSKSLTQRHQKPNFEFYNTYLEGTTNSFNWVLVTIDDRQNFSFDNTFYLPKLNLPKAQIYDNEPLSFPKTSGFIRYGGSVANNIKEVDAIVRITNIDTNNILYTQNLSLSPFSLSLPKGNYTIEYGITGLRNIDNVRYPINQHIFYKYYIEVISREINSMYDVLEQVRNTISKYGGIESKYYFEETRLFNIIEEHKILLKSIEAPQVFLETLTVRQILIFILSYINALPRVIRDKENSIDILDIEFYGERINEFVLEDILEISSIQDTTQIGTRSYSALKNILPNDLNEANVQIPSFYKGYSVRSTNIQMTDRDFELKLPKDKKIYMPISFEVFIDYTITNPLTNYSIKKSRYINLTDRFINKSEWDLKEVSTNFPQPYLIGAFNKDIGMKYNKLENIYWKQGDTAIQLSEVDNQLGSIFRESLIETIIYSIVREEVTLNPPEPRYIDDVGITSWDVTIDTINNLKNKFGATWYKGLKFNISYITSEELNIKQDKEDLTQINFYSEMRQNQEENTIALSRLSGKTYGNLQRTGNVEFSFMKVHRSLSEFYKVGQVDNDGYVITKVITEYYNEYIINTYFVTKEHNRISQATFIDQTYRKFDNYAQQITNRHETYNDYLILMPYEDRHLLVDEKTKIIHNEANIHLFNKIVFGILGIYHNVDEPKAKTALIRTDGFIEEYPNITEYNYQTEQNEVFSHYISVPITSAGFNQGLVFKFGFEDNQVAGDRLVNRGGNYFNQAIRYTNKKGKFKFLDFYIYNDIPTNYFIDEETRLDNYPLFLGNTNPELLGDNSTFIVSYFGTGNPIYSGRMGDDSLVVEKDMMTNFKLSYSLNILSYYNGKYIFGEKFYKQNHLVYNKNVNEKKYLFIYTNGEIYNIFENLKVKSGYEHKIDLSEEAYIFIDQQGNILNNHPLAENNTWAIGDSNDNLIFVANDGSRTIKVVETHFRPNVNEIGETTWVETEKLVYDFNIINTKQHLLSVDSILNVGYEFDILNEKQYLLNVESGLGTVYVFDIINEKQINTNIYGNLTPNYNFNIYNEKVYTLDNQGDFSPHYIIDIINEKITLIDKDGDFTPHYVFSIENEKIYKGTSSGGITPNYMFDIINDKYYVIEQDVTFGKTLTPSILNLYYEQLGLNDWGIVLEVKNNDDEVVIMWGSEMGLETTNEGNDVLLGTFNPNQIRLVALGYTEIDPSNKFVTIKAKAKANKKHTSDYAQEYIEIKDIN